MFRRRECTMVGILVAGVGCAYWWRERGFVGVKVPWWAVWFRRKVALLAVGNVVSRL